MFIRRYISDLALGSEKPLGPIICNNRDSGRHEHQCVGRAFYRSVRRDLVEDSGASRKVRPRRPPVSCNPVGIDPKIASMGAYPADCSAGVIYCVEWCNFLLVGQPILGSNGHHASFCEVLGSAESPSRIAHRPATAVVQHDGGSRRTRLHAFWCKDVIFEFHTSRFRKNIGHWACHSRLILAESKWALENQANISPVRTP